MVNSFLLSLPGASGGLTETNQVTDSSHTIFILSSMNTA